MCLERLPKEIGSGLFFQKPLFDYRLSEDRIRRQRLPMVAITDNKPVYDHCVGDGVVIRDKHLAIDMLVVRADLRSQQITLRWVDGRQMLVDSLTKMTASPDFLLFVMKYGKYICVDEGQTLEWKAQERNFKKSLNASNRGV